MGACSLDRGDVFLEVGRQFDLRIHGGPIMKKLSVLAIIVGGALLAAAPFSFQWSPEKNVVLSLDRADARVGRPLTATSVAGVHRRAARRAYRHGY
jgi:hypothetical protein